MESEDCTFPEVHTNGEKMAKLAAVGHEVLGYDTVAPYFSVINEAAALGANMSWGDMSHMPAVRRPYLFEEPKDFHIPPDFLERVPTRAVLEAISLLRQRFGDEVAIIGKVFGPWTLAYHLFGIEEFLVLIRFGLPRPVAVPVLHNQRLTQGGDCGRTTQRHLYVTGANLDRAECRMRPHVPPHVPRLLYALSGLEAAHDLLVVRPAAQMRWDSGAWEAAEGNGAR